MSYNKQIRSLTKISYIRGLLTTAKNTSDTNANIRSFVSSFLSSFLWYLAGPLIWCEGKAVFEHRGVFRGALGHAHPFWSEKYKNSQQKRVFHDHIVSSGGVMAQGVADPELTILKVIPIMNIFW